MSSNPVYGIILFGHAGVAFVSNVYNSHSDVVEFMNAKEALSVGLHKGNSSKNNLASIDFQQLEVP
jgi:hypothetical protein